MAKGFHGREASNEPWRARRGGLGSLALTRDGAPAVPPLRVYVSPSTTSLQVVQRSLSGGFLKEDAALLKANVRSMFDEARPHPTS